MEKYNKLTLIKEVGVDGGGRKIWESKCDCGNLVIRRIADIKSGNTKSCGCLNLEQIRKRHRQKTGFDKPVSKMPEYSVYLSAKRRCENSKDPAYPRYGGRGIKMKMSFKEMIDKIGFRPSQKHSLDRVDVNGNYEVSNIRWATDTQQARNKRTTKSSAGVIWREDTKKWRAYICVNTKIIHLGSYKKKADAISARMAGMVKYW